MVGGRSGGTLAPRRRGPDPAASRFPFPSFFCRALPPVLSIPMPAHAASSPGQPEAPPATALTPPSEPMSTPQDWTDTGRGPVVVLLHSSMASKKQWKSLVERLAPRWRVLAIDLHGYGDAPPAPEDPAFGLAHEATRVLSILDERLPAGTPWHLVGHSYGGGVALRVAHARPAQVLSMALYEPTAFHLVAPEFASDLAEVRAVARMAATHVPDDRVLRTGRFLDFWNGPGYFEQLPESRRAQFVPLLPKVALDFRGLFGDPLRPADHAYLGVPATLIGGRHSPRCTHRVIEALAGAWPQAAVRWVDAGHMGPLTHPGPVNDLLEAHLRAAEQGRQAG